MFSAMDVFHNGPFMPHGHYCLWTPGPVALNAISDALIVLAYYSIPVTSIHFVRNRRDLKLEWKFVCFAVFILAGGATHLREIRNIGHAHYWLTGGIKLVTALASVPTAILLARPVPGALVLPGADALQKACEERERRVEERTRELTRTARRLASEVAQRGQATDRCKLSLKESSDLDAALDQHAIVAITDPRGIITYVNDRFCGISKFSQEEPLGRDHRLINSGGHSREFFRDRWAAIGRGVVWQGEIRNRAKDGSIWWVATTIVPFLNEAGKPCQYGASRADLTGRKQAETALRESEARYRTRFECAPNGILMSGPHGCILDAIAAIRANERSRNLLVVVLTSSLEPRDLLECDSPGANSYVVKSQDAGLFSALVAEVGRYWLMVNQPPRLVGFVGKP